jgi:hypothetical protein
MAIAWTLLEILILFFYTNLHKFQQNENREEPFLNETGTSEIFSTTSKSGIESNEARLVINSNNSESESYTPDENSIQQPLLLNQKRKSKKKVIKYDSIKIVDNSETVPLPVRFYDEYIREEVVVVYASTFAVFFMQTCLETLLTPFTRDYFNWIDLENSILFGIAGLEVIIFSIINNKF